MALPVQKTCIREVKKFIQYHTNPTKARGYDLLTDTVLKELPQEGFRALTQIYNATLRLEYFPRYRKIGKVIMIARPGRDPTEVTSYRPISLVPVLSKLVGKLPLRRATPFLTSKQLIPDHQFGFRPQHGTRERAHRLVHKVHEDLHHKRHCTATFIDISRAFDKVWHRGLLYKLKRALPHRLYSIIK
jgi:hypothetical protein